MEEIKEKIAELKSLMRKNDSESEKRRNEIADWFKEHKTPEAEATFKDFLAEGLPETECEAEDLRKQISDED